MAVTATAINANGVIVGWSGLNSDIHAARWVNGVAKDLLAFTPAYDDYAIAVLAAGDACRYGPGKSGSVVQEIVWRAVSSSPAQLTSAVGQASFNVYSGNSIGICVGAVNSGGVVFSSGTPVSLISRITNLASAIAAIAINDCGQILILDTGPWKRALSG